ncbi:MAG: ATP-dependent 6-phosphofructokinase [Thermoproteota archaeon]|nr:ATP-dependent 6-phosphofructokinase [Candidatus Brockarchaeota archaeon]
MNIAIITSGGDAPGMNAAIRAVVRAASGQGFKTLGVEKGFLGLIENLFKPLTPRDVSGIINTGGSILKSSRCDLFKTTEGLEKASENLKSRKVDWVITMGGDGSMRGALSLSKFSGIPVTVIASSIDNDIAGIDETIGFDSAVNTAVEAIDKIRDTAVTYDRVFIVEVMGRNRGFLAVEVALASGAEFAVIPEYPITVEEIAKRIRQMGEIGKRSSIIVKAEGAMGDPFQTASQLRELTGYDLRVTVLGYIQRGGVPTARSRNLACLFGSYAVELVAEGKKNRLVGLKDGYIVDINIEESCKNIKKIDEKKYKLVSILAV